MPLVYVIIVNFNGLKWLKACIGSLLGNTYGNFKVILVDNDSADESASFVESQFPEVQVIQNPSNLGFCEGNNVGIRAALQSGADYCVLLNNDTVVTENWLEELIVTGEGHEEIGVLGSVQLAYDSTEFNSWTKSVAKKHIPELSEPASAREWIPMRWVEGSCFAVKRKVIEQIGELDPIYFMYFEEIDYCRRAAAYGYKIALVPRSRFHHFRGGTAKQSRESRRLRSRQYDRSHLIYHASDLRRPFVLNVCRYVLALGIKCYEQCRNRRLSRIWDLARLQPEMLRSSWSVIQKWKRDKRRLTEYFRARRKNLVRHNDHRTELGTG